MSVAYGILALVVLQRIGELLYASRNARALIRQGGIEYGRRHYPVMVLLHASWLTAIAVGIRRDSGIRMLPLTCFALAQALRVWVLATLGRYWTTRVISIQDVPLVQRGPYRFIRHPNYLIVVGEVALLPLVYGQIANAIVFSVLNAGVLAWRIRIEEAALASRRLTFTAES